MALMGKAPRPTDPYDVEGWRDFYAANPGALRAVGADAADGDLISGAEGDGEADTDSADLIAAPDGGEESDGEAEDTANPDDEADKGADPDKSDEADKDKGDEETVPDEYADFTLPEGMDVNTAMLDEFKPVAKELNLTQSQAQRLVDLQVKAEQARSEAAVAEWDKRFADWKAEARADKEIGLDKFDESVGYANKAVAEYMTADGYKALCAAGLQNHPEILRTFSRIGRTMSDDTMPNGNAGVTAPRDPVSVLYPDNK